MATLATLLKLTDDMYPNAVSVENKIDFMNMAQSELARKLGNIVEDSSLTTIADQEMYDFPSGITDISEILSLAIADMLLPIDRYNYTEYKISRADQNPATANSYFQIMDSEGDKKFVLYPTPSITGYTIVIRYRKRLTPLSAAKLNVEPEFDERHHHILSLFCCHMICSIGSSPDAYQSDMFMQKYQSALDELWSDVTNQRSTENRKRKDNPQWHRHNSYARGG